MVRVLALCRLPTSLVKRRATYARRFFAKGAKANAKKAPPAPAELSLKDKIFNAVDSVPLILYGVAFTFLPLFYFNYRFLSQRLNHDPEEYREQRELEEMRKQAEEDAVIFFFFTFLFRHYPNHFKKRNLYFGNPQPHELPKKWSAFNFASILIYHGFIVTRTGCSPPSVCEKFSFAKKHV